jgi:hypothetical protein
VEKNRSVESRGIDWDRAWECHQQLDAVLAWRTGYLIVAQCMLVAGFSALHASQNTDQTVKLAEYAICVAGIFLLMAQWAMSGAVIKHLAHLKQTYLEPLNPIYRGYTEMSFGPADSLQLYGIPAALWLLWVVLFELALWTQ